MRAGLAGLLLLASVEFVLVSSPSFAQTETRLPEQRYDIPSLPLNAALARFAQISHVDIIYDDTLAGNRRSADVSGQLTPQQALARLLAGTGLIFRFTRWNSALVYAPPAEVSTAPRSEGAVPVLVLDTMQVRASAIVGTPNRASFDVYGRHVLASIDRELRPEAVEEGRLYRAVIRLWIESDGSVRRVNFAQGSGDAKADHDIARRVSDLRFEAPPSDMPQPIRLQLEAR